MPLGAFKAALMGTAGVSTGGSVVLLSSQTASGDASISFTSGIDSTYGEYIFRFYIINPVSDQTNITWNGSIDSGSNYNVTKTTTIFLAENTESGGNGAISYRTAVDLAQSTDFHVLAQYAGNGSDESGAGELHLFNPSSTTYVKHWYSTYQMTNSGDSSDVNYTSGYFNTTSAVDAIQFKISSGNFDGIIKMWGVK
jgi:hypothetical protein